MQQQRPPVVSSGELDGVALAWRCPVCGDGIRQADAQRHSRNILQVTRSSHRDERHSDIPSRAWQRLCSREAAARATEISHRRAGRANARVGDALLGRGLRGDLVGHATFDFIRPMFCAAVGRHRFPSESMCKRCRRIVTRQRMRDCSAPWTRREVFDRLRMLRTLERDQGRQGTETCPDTTRDDLYDTARGQLAQQPADDYGRDATRPWEL
jgi:hypothetical protein